MTVAVRTRADGTRRYLVNVKWGSEEKRRCRYIGTYLDEKTAQGVSDAHTFEVLHPLADLVLRRAWR